MCAYVSFPVGSEKLNMWLEYPPNLATNSAGFRIPEAYSPTPIHVQAFLNGRPTQASIWCTQYQYVGKLGCHVAEIEIKSGPWTINFQTDAQSTLDTVFYILFEGTRVGVPCESRFQIEKLARVFTSQAV